MKKKLISIALAASMIFSAAVFTGCGNSDFPVDVANMVIESEPKNIVMLDPCIADIISYIGYDLKTVGRSEEVDQEWLEEAPNVGLSAAPDVEKIKATEADIVFAGENLDENIKKNIEDAGIRVITMAQAKTQKQLETNYITLGKILGGKKTGAEKGVKAYGSLIDAMDKVKSTVKTEVGAEVLYTVCYLYLEQGSLKLMTSGTYGNMLLSYTGAVNAAVNIDENKVDVNTLKIANPNFIFYSDEDTLNAIKADPVLKKLSAVKNGKTFMVTYNDINRQGRTALETLDKLVGFMYPSLRKSTATGDEASNTVPTDNPAAAEVSVAEKYKIKLDGLSLKYEDENNNVKIMQKRLYDLGYVTDKENITGYYGELSKEAVQNFQKNNDIKETGSADNATLVKMFDENAVKNG